MALEDRRKNKSQAASTISETERIVTGQVPANRREEMLEHLKLFGYKPRSDDTPVAHCRLFWQAARRRKGGGKEGSDCEKVRRPHLCSRRQDARPFNNGTCHQA